MNRIDFLKEQIIESRDFVNRLISEIPQELWYTIPQTQILTLLGKLVI